MRIDVNEVMKAIGALDADSLVSIAAETVVLCHQAGVSSYDLLMAIEARADQRIVIDELVATAREW